MKNIKEFCNENKSKPICIKFTNILEANYFLYKMDEFFGIKSIAPKDSIRFTLVFPPTRCHKCDCESHYDRYWTLREYKNDCDDCNKLRTDKPILCSCNEKREDFTDWRDVISSLKLIDAMALPRGETV